MKLTTIDNVIERSGDLNDEETFSIALTSKAIEILSSQIYKNAYKAILRELGTNAADSHIEAGKKDLPFDVYLPTFLSPELTVRDYGVGMSYEKTMSMYRTYFGSDKTKSNDTTGCLGLGSKSPLAYTDQFSVTCWYNGEKSVYTIYKNEKGLPCINRIFHGPSDEPQGVEVKIAIKKSDFHLFEQNAKDVYQWFSPRPKMLNVKNFVFPERPFDYSGKGWGVSKDSNSYRSDLSATVVMGNVAYTVDNTDLNNLRNDTKYGLSYNDCNIFLFKPVIWVDIGDVDIAANRESLKFDSGKTFQTLAKFAKQITSDIKKDFETKLQTCPTLWEARKLVRKSKHCPILSKCLASVDVKWKGKVVETNISVVSSQLRRAEVEKYYVNSRHLSKTMISTSKVWDIKCEENAEIFISDSRNQYSRIRHYLRGRSKLTEAVVYLISQAVEPEKINPNLPDVKVEKLEDFIKDEQLTVRKTSELPDPPRTFLNSGRNPTYQILEPNSQSVTSSKWRESTVDFDTGGIYVPVVGNFWLIKERELTASSLEDIIKAIGQPVIGVRKKKVKDFEESDDWISLTDFIKDFIKNDPSILTMAREYKIASYVEDGSFLDNDLKLDVDSGPIHVLQTELQAIASHKSKKHEEKSNIYDTLRRFFSDIPSLDNLSISKFEKMQKDIMKKYPLLEHIEWFKVSREPKLKKAVQQYVDLIG